METILVAVSPEQWQTAALEELADPYIRNRMDCPALLLEFCGPAEQRISLVMLQGKGMLHAEPIQRLSNEWAELAGRAITPISDHQLLECATALNAETQLNFSLALLRRACEQEPLQHPPAIANRTIHQRAALHGVAGLGGTATRVHLKQLLGNLLGLKQPWVQRPPDFCDWQDGEELQTAFDQALAASLSRWYAANHG